MEAARLKEKKVEFCLGSFSKLRINWSRGVTVSTLDSESSDRGSNPRGTFFARCEDTKLGPELTGRLKPNAAKAWAYALRAGRRAANVPGLA